jgi:ADP-ribosylglycohydrolase
MAFIGAGGELPADHAERMRRARLSLEGLSVGDAFGEGYFGWTNERLARTRTLHRAPWPYTDDTAMAVSIVEVLDRRGGVEPDDLARRFAERYRAEPDRGYGGMAQRILSEIGRGLPWAEAAGRAFDGEGSMGNGGAMRAGPVGAYFADDPHAAAEHAAASARVTHAHPDGQAGAIAVAVAAAQAWQMRDQRRDMKGRRLIEAAIEYTADGPTRSGLRKALGLPLDSDIETAVNLLGNGSRVISSDTVPFTLWCAARHPDDYEEALWATPSGRGDRDTTCAIVGSIVALSVGLDGIPGAWRAAREPLPI